MLFNLERTVLPVVPLQSSPIISTHHEWIFIIITPCNDFCCVSLFNLLLTSPSQKIISLDGMTQTFFCFFSSMKKKMDSNCLAKLSATMDVLHNGWNETTHFSSTRFEKNKEETITATIY